ncbi:alpha/beta hydrolase family protein [Rhodobacter viridis]|uniref:Alpha/beta hydrolase family protein n=1 Tax=Rhodobacter viridis TaxID=1054202 RepID=A0A318TX06_9RHOB|nr:alpha/beta fold hydrolase [Rhodobacter viridis]PYF09232.1 alpha/beta hydrolase family protein [Rhodobacter viridis]
MLIRAFLVLCLSAVPAAADCVLLLHGLARSPRSLFVLEQVLEARGKRVVNLGYPSTEETVEALAGRIEAGLAACGPGPVDVVTHSMGGILLQVWAERGANAKRIHRAVMLAPPNGGSEIVDTFRDQAWFGWMNGPAGLALGTGASDAPARLPKPKFDFAVIAGSDSLNPITSWLIPGPDDGKVSVASAKQAGMADFLVLPVTHTWMMDDPRVIVEVLAFLDRGQFEPVPGWGAALKRLAAP